MSYLRTILWTAVLLPLIVPATLSQPVDIASRPQRAERHRSYDALHYRVHLVFDEATKSFSGTNTITLTPLGDGLTHVVLDAETFTVDSVVIGVSGSALDFEQPPHALIVEFPASYGPGDTLTFTVSYHADNVDIESEKFGVSATYDLGIDFKDKTENNPQLINTLSFPRGARHWMPCYDHPNDRASNETLLTVRAGYKALSNGRLVSVTEEEGGMTTWHWRQELPHPTYLYVAVAGPYVVLEDSLGSIPVNYWVYPEDVDDAMRSFARTPEIMAFLETVYDTKYPWVKYDQITIPGIGGGAESTTATVLGESTIHDAAAEQDFPSDWLVAHEAAHQWWGNLVSYRDWPETWISESFATYSEYLWARHAHGDDEGAVNLLRKKERYLNEAHTRYIRSIVFDRWDYPNDNFDRHTYQKGAVVLGMLRMVMGEEPFLRAIAHFLQKHAYQPVTTRDLVTAITEETGQNLDWFFDQWIFSPGHPQLTVTKKWDDAARRLRLTVEQTQDTLQGVPVFRLPVRIGIVTETERRVESVVLEDVREEFAFDVPDEPLLVRFDEGNHLLKEWTFEKTTPDLLYQLRRDDVIGRSWAAGELGLRFGEPTVTDALRQCGEEDAFWYVRAVCIEQLVGDQTLIAFMKARSRDSHSKVRTAALHALGHLADEGMVDFFKERFEADDSYVARAEALRGLGLTGDPGVRRYLETAATLRSPRNVLRTAAEWALAELSGVD